MSRHQEELTLPLALAECMAACERAASSPGWRTTERQATSIQCTEAAQAAFGFTNPVQVSIALSGTGASTRVTLHASNLGFGPFQSRHVREQTQRLRQQIEAEASRPAEPKAPPAQSTLSVYINGIRLSDAQLQSIEQTYRIHVQDGRYWYDPVCGAWGLEGGPQCGVAVAGLALGGPLRADASNGTSGVFVNGRELHAVDVARVIGLVGTVLPGRWWTDAQGNFGPEGWPMVGNLFVLAQQRTAEAGGSSNEVVSKYCWLTCGDGFISFMGAPGSSVSASIGG